MSVAAESGPRVQVRVFYAITPHELAEQVNAFLAGIPSVSVRAVRFQTSAVAATMDDLPCWEYAALVEFEAV